MLGTARATDDVLEQQQLEQLDKIADTAGLKYLETHKFYGKEYYICVPASGKYLVAIPGDAPSDTYPLLFQAALGSVFLTSELGKDEKKK